MSGLKAGDPAKQWEWHESYRDQFKNMYRTSYSDMAHGRETYVRSDYPAGYGGHIPSMRFDVLHRNTQFDRNISLSRTDPSRDAFPSFKPSLEGLPWYTKHPCGAHNNPTKGVVPHSGHTTELKPPWGIMPSRRQPLNYRAVPPTMRKSASSPAMGGLSRSNPSAMSAGAMLAGSGDGHMSAEPSYMEHDSYDSEGGGRLKRTVHMANEHAKAGSFPHESEILQEQLGM
mmetsp:Transcript_17192/g.30140  ORF Transcript_17192/g.30140 Transcript_17192/m.30140 type:complete len:229 (-) Transcript_17192:39-725(-)|eukprot:CAMPEP_0197652306 /NCGR_PEP_ID=MMETSP1338-20131121/34370_1 /TAXON_ID=43686 ORGANISM="Pelagodinium beii, Strain RCC1491" /NCGR_SAMPLE_ID=MMETSP1338 /ASSEMBLY_ACC=CAM_ASM_000754 /LENGTH=228 /DNA_ID=CAMNT_0043227153 /DNA_START=83 /DNA_END=769 /DNA_ORIENTATION=+